MKSSRVKRLLNEGGVCIGTMLRILKSVHAVSLYASNGWDYIILDTEHNDFDPETLSNISLVAKYVQMDVFVRVPDKLYFQMAQMLDLGAEGIIVPRVNTREDTENIIRSTKYSPIGRRGVSISGTATLFQEYSQVEYTEWANQETMIIIQIESEEGINNIEKILSVQGIDAIMIGPADLSQDMGIPGQIHHPRMDEALHEIIHQCNKYKVAPGIHFSELDDVRKWIKEGMRFITYSYDIKFINEALKDAVKKLRVMI